jgi:hypothetical protein
MKEVVDAGAEKTEEEHDEGKQEETANLAAAFCLKRLGWVLVCDGGGRKFSLKLFLMIDDEVQSRLRSICSKDGWDVILER